MDMVTIWFMPDARKIVLTDSEGVPTGMNPLVDQFDWMSKDFARNNLYIKDEDYVEVRRDVAVNRAALIVAENPQFDFVEVDWMPDWSGV